MIRTALSLAGLAAALAIGAATSDTSAAAPATADTAWVERRVAEVSPGQPYRLDACLTISAAGVEVAILRASWYESADGTGAAIYRNDRQANAGLIGTEQCLTMSGLLAPCAAHSVAYGVLAVGDATAVSVSSLSLTPDTGATPVACPTPTPHPTPTLEPPPPAPSPTAKPPPAASTPPPKPAVEPISFPALVNGGFERLREDGTLYGWRKVGGELFSTEAKQTEGHRAAALVSRTESTKWLYQAVAVKGGAYYRLSAKALLDGPAAREALLRVSWYASADSSGSQLSTDESQPLSERGSRFVALDTGPVQAPAEARSARLRLLLRPASAATATAYFDDVRFEETPATSDAATGGPAEGNEPGASGASRPAAPASAALSAWLGPTPLANSSGSPEAAPSTAGGDRPLWPFLLALTAPAIGLPLLAAGARRRPSEGERDG